MASTKPAIASGTLWGGLIAFVPFLTQVYETVVNSGVVLPPKVAAIFSGVGAALVLIRRWTNKDIKPISGVIVAKDQ